MRRVLSNQLRSIARGHIPAALRFLYRARQVVSAGIYPLPIPAPNKSPTTNPPQRQPLSDRTWALQGQNRARTRIEDSRSSSLRISSIEDGKAIRRKTCCSRMAAAISWVTAPKSRTTTAAEFRLHPAPCSLVAPPPFCRPLHHPSPLRHTRFIICPARNAFHDAFPKMRWELRIGERSFSTSSGRRPQGDFHFARPAHHLPARGSRLVLAGQRLIEPASPPSIIHPCVPAFPRGLRQGAASSGQHQRQQFQHFLALLRPTVFSSGSCQINLVGHSMIRRNRRELKCQRVSSLASRAQCLMHFAAEEFFPLEKPSERRRLRFSLRDLLAWRSPTGHAVRNARSLHAFLAPLKIFFRRAREQGI